MNILPLITISIILLKMMNEQRGDEGAAVANAAKKTSLVWNYEYGSRHDGKETQSSPQDQGHDQGC